MLRTLAVITTAIIPLVFLTSCAPAGPIVAPNAKASSISQIPINKNGCGPVALMNSYEFGSPRWNKAGKTIAGSSNKKKFTNLINKYGRRLSKHSTAKIRWNKNNGINSLDLTDLANEYQNDKKLNLPELKLRTLFIQNNESHSQLLKRAHRELSASLRKGFPPIISIKRFARSPYGRANFWRQHYGHFVVVHEIPSSLPLGATSFTIKYIDPWGGRIKTGTIKIPEKGFFAIDPTSDKPILSKSPTLAIDFPYTSLGKHTLKKNQKSATIIASSISP